MTFAIGEACLQIWMACKIHGGALWKANHCLGIFNRTNKRKEKLHAQFPCNNSSSRTLHGHSLSHYWKCSKIFSAEEPAQCYMLWLSLVTSANPKAFTYGKISPPWYCNCLSSIQNLQGGLKRSRQNRYSITLKWEMFSHPLEGTLPFRFLSHLEVNVT